MLNLEAIKQRHLRKEQMDHRTFYEGHIVIDLAACVDELEYLERVKEGCVELNAALSRIDYLCGEPNKMEGSEYDVHANPTVVVDRIAALVAEVKRLRRESDLIVAWLRRNPGVSRGPECVTAMTPFEAADAIQRGVHRREEGP